KSIRCPVGKRCVQARLRTSSLKICCYTASCFLETIVPQRQMIRGEILRNDPICKTRKSEFK
ncbi:unnamed protein product, partial [Amoebophrya sp. A25]